MSEPQPFLRVITMLEEFISSADFQKKIAKLRRKIKIPDIGLPFMNKEEILGDIKALLRYSANLNRMHEREARIGLEKIIKDFPLYNLHMWVGFKIYLFHNEYIKEVFERNFFRKNLCYLVDAKNDLEEFYDEDSARHYFNIQEDLFRTYPLALYIHQEASQRDIVDYVRKLWPLFERYKKPYQRKKANIWKVKKKDSYIKERNDYIFNNRHLPRKQIMALVNEKYKVLLDYGHIGKIISLEKKRRKEV